MRLYSTLAFLCAVKFIFLKIYSMLILYSHISRRGFEVLNEILQISAYVTIHCHRVLQYVPLLVNF